MHNRYDFKAKQLEPGQNDDFDAVYQAAKKCDVKALRALQPHVCINMRNAACHSPASQLAYEGHLAAAELLRTEFGAITSNIAFGAALGGQLDYAEYLRIHHGASLRSLIEGAAAAKNRDYLTALLEHLTDEQELYSYEPPHVWNIAEGAAYGGDPVTAEYYREIFDISPTQLARKAISGGQFEYAEFLRTQLGASASVIALDASSAAYLNYVDYLRIQDDTVSNANIASGAAFTNQRRRAESIRTTMNQDHWWIGFNAAKGGQRRYAEFLRESGVIVDAIAQGAAAGEQLDYVEYLFTEHSASIAFIGLETNKSRFFTNEDSTLRTLIFLKNNAFREAITRRVYTPHYFKYSINCIERRATHVNTLIDEQRFNHTQALAWTEPELQCWFLQGVQLVSQKKLSYDTFLMIGSFLSPLRGMTGRESKDLQKKMFNHLRPNFFIREQNKKRRKRKVAQEGIVMKKMKT
ncbi:MAG: hypothetical protein SFW66_03505 [Gammaproteobacteria bacterium]|nr:hypothetical protein [Gammaproteobacteria bacterium]